MTILIIGDWFEAEATVYEKGGHTVKRLRTRSKRVLSKGDTNHASDCVCPAEGLKRSI